MDSTKRYVKFAHARPCCMILTLVACAVVSAPFMMKLGSTTEDSFSARKGSRGYKETELFKSQFPDVFNDVETIYIQCIAGSCDAEDFRPVFQHLREGLSKYTEDGTLVSLTDFFNYSESNLSVILNSSYYNESAKSMKASLEFNTSKADDAVKEAVTEAIELTQNLDIGGMDAYITGQLAANILSSDAAGALIGMADGTGMIFIVLLFAWQVGSWRLTLIPVINTGLVLFIAEGLIYPFSKSGIITLASYVPNVCLFLAIALSVDYSFFHLSRFQEKRQEGNDLTDAVDSMVRTAGRVVLVSGVVLLFTWLALAAFPVFGTDSLGYASAITIFVCIVVNLVMNPALIFACPKFFGNASQDACRCCKRRSAAGASSEPFAGIRAGDVENNCYGRVASAIVKMPCMVLVPLVVYAILTPAAVRIFSADLVVGGSNGNTPKTEYATTQILKDFPNSMGGVPLSIILEAPGTGDNRVQNAEFFTQACYLAKNVSEAIGFGLDDFRGANLLNGDCIDWLVANASLSSEVYEYFWDLSMSKPNTSIAMTVSLDFDAFSNKAKALVLKGRDAVDSFAKGGYGHAAIFHPMAVEVDAEQLVQHRFVWVVLVTLFVVFSVIAIRYGAALIPVKLLFTIALPIVSVIGTGVFVFQDGALNWTGIPSLKSQGGLVWINPVACTFMLIGFALDYDLFLFSRIYADRKEGRFLDDRKAIVHAVAVTGPVITTAGVIMALAFSGMVVQSTNPFLCQMGFTMIYGILMDTFVVRTLLVPAFLSMAGRYNWWPGQMPSEASVES